MSDEQEVKPVKETVEETDARLIEEENMIGIPNSVPEGSLPPDDVESEA